MKEENESCWAYLLLSFLLPNSYFLLSSRLVHNLNVMADSLLSRLSHRHDIKIMEEEIVCNRERDLAEERSRLQTNRFPLLHNFDLWVKDLPVRLMKHTLTGRTHRIKG